MTLGVGPRNRMVGRGMKRSGETDANEPASGSFLLRVNRAMLFQLGGREVGGFFYSPVGEPTGMNQDRFLVDVGHSHYGTARFQYDLIAYFESHCLNPFWLTYDQLTRLL